MNEFKQGAAKSLGKIASITGDAATDGVCIGFIYEPKELLVNKALNK